MILITLCKLNQATDKCLGSSECSILTWFLTSVSQPFSFQLTFSGRSSTLSKGTKSSPADRCSGLWWYPVYSLINSPDSYNTSDKIMVWHIKPYKHMPRGIYQVGKLVHGDSVAKDVCVLVVVVNVVLVGFPSDTTQELFLVWWIFFSVDLRSKDRHHNVKFKWSKAGNYSVSGAPSSRAPIPQGIRTWRWQPPRQPLVAVQQVSWWFWSFLGVECLKVYAHARGVFSITWSTTTVHTMYDIKIAFSHIATQLIATEFNTTLFSRINTMSY